MEYKIINLKQAQYEKEVQKGKIKPEDPNAEQFLDVIFANIFVDLTIFIG